MKFLPFLLAAVWIHQHTPIRTIDGDTFVTQIEIRPGLIETQHVRLVCSAPELKEDGGIAARDALAAFLDGGTVLRTEWKREKYGRLLGDVVSNAPGRDGGYCR